MRFFPSYVNTKEEKMATVEIIKANKTILDRSKSQESNILRVAAYCRVSRNTEDQLNSYKSQVRHYTDMITSNNEWHFVDIYADEAITGTQTKKREDFQRLINDCMNKKIDMVITKSISRFARNTLDTLKYVRMLKEKNIAVYFEDEKINTLTMDGELLLVVLSSVAQQEVENISANVKKGLKMKMRRGELVGSHDCLGYNYDFDNKKISINEEEAKIVRFIFDRYLEGFGTKSIAKQLMAKGVLTKRGNSKWHASGVLGILKNEKYKGDIIQGKTFTVDPISKRRLSNKGEEDKFQLKNNHEPIISVEIFEKAQSIRRERWADKDFTHKASNKRRRVSRIYALSSMVECGFCGKHLSRKSWNGSTKSKKVIWHCSGYIGEGKKSCEYCKGIAEEAIKTAFVESYKQLQKNNTSILETFLNRIGTELSLNKVKSKIIKLDKEIKALYNKNDILVNMRLEENLDKTTYDEKSKMINSEIDKLEIQRVRLKKTESNEKKMEERIKGFKHLLEGGEIIEEFDRYIFESIVDKVVVGEIDESGIIDPYKIIFVYKTGNIDEYSTKKTISKRCSKRTVDSNTICSNVADDTY
jgi:DNA invertase Pin-like site-specific DNA recombinase